MRGPLCRCRARDNGCISTEQTQGRQILCHRTANKAGGDAGYCKPVLRRSLASSICPSSCEIAPQPRSSASWWPSCSRIDWRQRFKVPSFSPLVKSFSSTISDGLSNTRAGFRLAKLRSKDVRFTLSSRKPALHLHIDSRHQCVRGLSAQARRSAAAAGSKRCSLAASAVFMSHESCGGVGNNRGKGGP